MEPVVIEEPEQKWQGLTSALEMSDFEPDEGLAYINEIMAEDDANDPMFVHYQK
jgi:hypothetical protein